MKFAAEISCSHQGDIEQAKQLIRDCTLADMVKFQTWTPDTMAIPGERIESGPWAGRELADLYREAYTPAEWLPDLFREAEEHGVTPFSTPFDRRSVELLEGLGCKAYKIASYELVDLQLIEAVAMTGKPLIFSTGQAEKFEIRAAVVTALKWNEDITLLHCVSEYPTPLESANLKTIQGLKEVFPYCKVGLSCHSTNPIVPVTAAVLGVDMIEMHVGRGGLDADFALSPEQFGHMVASCRDAVAAVGEIQFATPDFPLRRSLYFAEDLKAGTEIQGKHIKTARPNLGLSPIKIDKVLGRKLNLDVTCDQPVELRLLS